MTTAEKQPESPSGMMSRFTGGNGQARLLEALTETTLLRGIDNIADFVAGAKLIEIPQGSAIIDQGSVENDLYLILSGSFNIIINGRHIATRGVGSHVGEMALIDYAARRSATVVAAEHSLVLKCPEPHFTDFADAHPKVWRRIAVELSRRLTERSKLIPVPRSEPVLFLGCAKESLDIAREIQTGFDHDPLVVEIWTDGVFNPSQTPIEDLDSLIRRIDFGVIVFSPDDKITSRNNEAFGPRDNVVFELGLLIGAIGRDRTFILVRRGVEMKLPSDLIGIKTIDYADGDCETMKSRLGPACNELRKIINRLGPL